MQQLYALTNSMPHTDSAYLIKTDHNPDAFSDINVYTRIKEHIPENDIDSSILWRIKRTPITGEFSSRDTLELYSSTIRKIFYDNGYFQFIVDEKKNFIVYNKTNTSKQVEYIIKRINIILEKYFNMTIYTEKVLPAHTQTIERRIKETEQYYLDTHGLWTQKFIDALGDDISRASFRFFIEQRMRAQVCWGRTSMYPILPPPQTEAWRAARRSAPPPLPYLGGCRWKEVQDALYLHTFIYEQYAIPGVIEALPGHCVIDAGAYVGDTTVYFSRKTGITGKVYAFEPVPDSIVHAKENMRRNDCSNVEIICAALADKNKTLQFTVPPERPAASHCRNSVTRHSDETPALPLDDFVATRSIVPNFLKADIEGGEMDLLRGAQQAIQNHAPACAIALYHTRSDYHEIPQYLNMLCPKYLFFFRCEAEPVLFAAKF